MLVLLFLFCFCTWATTIPQLYGSNNIGGQYASSYNYAPQSYANQGYNNAYNQPQPYNAQYPSPPLLDIGNIPPNTPAWSQWAQQQQYPPPFANQQGLVQNGASQTTPPASYNFNLAIPPETYQAAYASCMTCAGYGVPGTPSPAPPTNPPPAPLGTSFAQPAFV